MKVIQAHHAPRGDDRVIVIAGLPGSTQHAMEGAAIADALFDTLPALTTDHLLAHLCRRLAGQSHRTKAQVVALNDLSLNI